MPKNVVIDECPKCKKDIRKELLNELLGRLRGDFFDFDCPHCGASLEIGAVPVPEFGVSLKAAQQTASPDAATNTAQVS